MADSTPSNPNPAPPSADLPDRLCTWCRVVMKKRLVLQVLMGLLVLLAAGVVAEEVAGVAAEVTIVQEPFIQQLCRLTR